MDAPQRWKSTRPPPRVMTSQGVCFNHSTKTASLREKTLRKLKGATPPRKISVGELESLTSRVMYAAGVQGGSLFRRYFFFKTARRRPPRLNRGPFGAQDLAAQPPFAMPATPSRHQGSAPRILGGSQRQKRSPLGELCGARLTASQSTRARRVLLGHSVILVGLGARVAAPSAVSSAPSYCLVEM
ncbi:hypothetical protein DQ04_08501030, partial [Trypanosoma grayi]|uniref:hypothetical protein n=1 Tax=Trypanosoma grayi TaxID=71804 RepID=UPI0004F414FB